MAIPLKYNVRSLLVRRVSTLMTGGGIALVVAVFVVVMAMVAGLASLDHRDRLARQPDRAAQGRDHRDLLQRFSSISSMR